MRTHWKLFLALTFTILATHLYLRVLRPLRNLNSGVDKVVIGAVACLSPTVGKSNPEYEEIKHATEELITLIKSVFLSASIVGVKQIDLHIFTDSQSVTDVIQQNIEEINAQFVRQPKATAYFYNAFDSVSRDYFKDVFHLERKCEMVRFFFPSALPSNVTEILYLDNDVIITGSIAQIWKTFREKVITSVIPAKLASMVQNSKYGYFYRIYHSQFRNVKHVPPRGVNAGVMFMNLDAIRKFPWTELLFKYLHNKTNLNDQQMLNILFYNFPERLVQVSCQYNFQHLHCEQGLACTDVMTDPGGIYIMHGAGGMFNKPGRSHYKIYEYFRLFNISQHKDVVSLLYKPIIEFYNSEREELASCDGMIGEYLFRSLM